MLSSKALRLCEAICLFYLFLTPLNAQVNRNGAVSGVVTGADDSLISKATIVLMRSDGSTRTTSTSPEGTFSLDDLPSGTYTLKATSSGFAAYTQSSVAVAVGRNTHLLIKLALAGTQETVSVNAEQTAFDTSQTSSVVNIDRDRVEELPIPNRNYLTFVLLSPQVAPANPAFAQQTLTQGNGGFSFGGLRPGGNAVYLDGVDDDAHSCRRRPSATSRS
jgi:hypothetical protein